MLEHFFCDDWLEKQNDLLIFFSCSNFNWKFGNKKKEKKSNFFPPPPFAL